MTAAEVILNAYSERMPTGIACRTLNVHYQTLHKMGKRGEISFELTATKRHLWNVRGYLERRAEKAA